MGGGGLGDCGSLRALCLVRRRVLRVLRRVGDDGTAGDRQTGFDTETAETRRSSLKIHGRFEKRPHGQPG